jgi:hypothetical protein
VKGGGRKELWYGVSTAEKRMLEHFVNRGSRFCKNGLMQLFWFLLVSGSYLELYVEFFE